MEFKFFLSVPHSGVSTIEDLHCPHFSGPIQEPDRMNTTSETSDDLLSVVIWDVEINFLLKKGDMKVCLLVIFWIKVKSKIQKCPYVFLLIYLEENETKRMSLYIL